MIWTQGDLLSTHYNQEIPDCCECPSEANRNIGPVPFKTAVIGGGPKGLYALDHLITELSLSGITEPVELYWFNAADDFGSGPNYRRDQPEYLLINYCIANIDAWYPYVNRSAGQLNLADWIRKNKASERPVRPEDFASRALVGRYLQEVMSQIMQSRPSNLQIKLINANVSGLNYQDGFTIKTNDPANTFYADNVLLATGHCYTNSKLLSNSFVLTPSKTNDQGCYINNAYPLTGLKKVEDQSKVGVLGLGLTFIDVVLTLTEGRGGHFDEQNRYQSGGREPLIYACSRNNLPILARGPVYTNQGYQLFYFTGAWRQHMSALRKTRKIDFKEEILPLVEQEIQFAYYSTLLETRDPKAIQKYLRDKPVQKQFGLQKLLFELPAPEDAAGVSLSESIEYNIREAEKGELKSPLMAAAAVWRELTPIIREFYKEGGLIGASQQFLHEELMGAFCRTSFGPPVDNMKKILSLINAGIICIPQPPAHEQVEVDYIVDARVGKPALAKGNASLYQQLLDDGLITPFDNDGYQPGCPDMDATGQVRNESKSQIPLFCYGTNTEGVLLDNDSLSRTANNTGLLWAKTVIRQLSNKNEVEYAGK